jgi:predicted nucleotidyltransferase
MLNLLRIEQIKSELREIEQQEDVRILHAVESGSRAWGFASTDSDYDVRFIYVRQPEFYLRLGKTRDVIEWKLDEVLDINGWDLQKALRLLRKSNPTLFEWASSPLVYHTTPEWGKISVVFPDYFLSKPGLYHYLSMAKGNYREYLKGDRVKVKKYLYVLRPILAAKWILSKGTPPPMLFTELVTAEAGSDIADEIAKLLEIKMNTPETEIVPKIKPIDDYIGEILPDLQAQASDLAAGKAKGYAKLDRLFLETLKGMPSQ